ncbi:GMC oxidoreductase [Dichomitus squalens]|nr:GMC oxidoreductase [Dichomitus squalens]
MGVLTSKAAPVSGPSSIATPWTPTVSSVVSKVETEHWKSFDYIIVGGGPAGCVLASRLSEDRTVSVLLVEAGKSHEGNLFSRIPLAWNKLLKSDADWNYDTAPQETIHGRTVYWPRGKILGGTSSINAMIYHQCPPDDFDAWERRGATGWGYANLKHYFEKALQDGPRKSKVPLLAPVCAAVLKAAEALGLPIVNDFDTEGTLGAGAFAAAVHRAERSSAAVAYLSKEVRSRPNLTVVVSTFTERILFTEDLDGVPRAIGVQLSTGPLARRFAVRAKREVILCSGVVGSPQLLQLSGIGDASQLEQLGIPVVRDLPSVGCGLLDHFSAGTLVLRAKPGCTWDHLTQNPLYAALAMMKWLFFGRGPMASLSAQIGIFTKLHDPSLPYGPTPLPIKDLTSGPNAPDLEFMVFPVAVINYGLGFPRLGNYGISVGAVLLKPASTGTVSIRSSSVYDPPNIDPRYFEDESDLNALIRGTRFILHLARTAPLSSALDLLSLSTAPQDPDFYWPGDADPDKVSDEELEAWVKTHATSALHPTSSARMGTDLTTSAVDLRLRVHGVRSLRVVDASVFPDQVSGHPCVPVIAIAERAADLVKSDFLASQLARS